ncbi:helix-turn-helix transcriptional regulator [Polaribacter sp.]|uniref:helix-turn-helix transcriptional regulator n=1 Tax=Polaribacter sp. TaxID=1920175 RepID=UPI003EF4E1CE
MKQVQLVGITTEEHNSPIFNYIDKKFEELKQHFQPKEPNKYLKREEVAEMIRMKTSSVHNITKDGTLTKYQISGRVLYKRSEVEAEIKKIKK